MKNKLDVLWRQIKTCVIIALVCTVVFALAYGWASYEMGIWHECLRDHSWFYCHRVLS